MFSLMPWRREKTGRSLMPRSELPFRRLENEIATLFDRFFDGGPTPLMELWETPPLWATDVEETEKEVVARVELPGFELGELNVSVRGDLLTIEAKHEEKAKGKEEGERGFAQVKRTLALPKGVEAEKIEACYRNGVLEVHMPKTPEAEGRRVEVKA